MPFMTLVDLLMSIKYVFKRALHRSHKKIYRINSKNIMKRMCPSSPVQSARCFIETRVNKSLAIPMPASHIQRTESELQLHEETAVAEYRDQCMFNRLIRGIRHRQQQCNMVDLSHTNCDSNRGTIPMVSFPSEFIEETERSIGNIISTRNRSANFSQDAGKVIPADSGDLQIIEQHNTYHTDERSHILRHPSREFDDWTIGGFDNTVPMPNMIHDFSMIQTEAIPDMYESDEYSCCDDEVFDIDL